MIGCFPFQWEPLQTTTTTPSKYIAPQSSHIGQRSLSQRGELRHTAGRQVKKSVCTAPGFGWMLLSSERETLATVSIPTPDAQGGCRRRAYLEKKCIFPCVAKTVLPSECTKLNSGGNTYMQEGALKANPGCIMLQWFLTYRFLIEISAPPDWCWTYSLICVSLGQRKRKERSLNNSDSQVGNED